MEPDKSICKGRPNKQTIGIQVCRAYEQQSDTDTHAVCLSATTLRPPTPSSDSEQSESCAERLAYSFLALTNTHHRRPSFDEPRTHTLEMNGFGGDRKYVVQPPIIPDSMTREDGLDLPGPRTFKQAIA
ncbi:uncharacterized protein B0T23DRAFT_395525 [Neurospora hispaniola]|uniref:Uncharacterized protein n=1 Tax=Neurospora hispaniola TaxID=588809 RepID=A0AAJ0I7A5_9PEZI|nr:hypothetical protein B0T23DRAFT_395525 [Neurospora hispaniola]